MQKSQKLVALESLRGLAALVVVFGHFAMNFVTPVHDSLIGSPAFAVLNGPAAVMLFFVLSGFVLTLRVLRTRDPGLVGWAALKRWPRLAGPVVMSACVFMAGAFLGAFPTPEAVVASGQPIFGALTWGHAREATKAAAVLWEAAVGTFVLGTARHNDVLWTMHFEFLGSYLAFAMAVVVVWVPSRLLRYACVAGLAVLAGAYSFYMLCFMLGVVVAWAHLRFFEGRAMPLWAGVLALAVAVYLFGFRTPVGAYAIAAGVPGRFLVPFWVFIESAAAVLFMAAALYCRPVRRVLESGFGALIGRLSFPVYLLHPFVLWSATSWGYLLLAGTMSAPALSLVLFAVTMAGTLALAWPLMLFDEWWTRFVNRIFSPQPAPAAVAQSSRA